MEINKLIPIGSRILTLNYYIHWLRSDLLQLASKTSEKKFGELKELDLQWRQIYENGFDYIFIDSVSHPSYYESFTRSDLPDWVRMEKIYKNENLSAYRLIFSNEITRRWSRKKIMNIKNSWDVN